MKYLSTIGLMSLFVTASWAQPYGYRSIGTAGEISGTTKIAVTSQTLVASTSILTSGSEVWRAFSDVDLYIRSEVTPTVTSVTGMPLPARTPTNIVVEGTHKVGAVLSGTVAGSLWLTKMAK